jgi:hypothetical protein
VTHAILVTYYHSVLCNLWTGKGMAFLTLQRVFSPRLCASIPTLARPLLERNVHLALRELPERPIAPKRDPTKLQSGIGPHARPVENIQTAEDFLKAIGRESETKLKVQWDELWKMDGRAMREAGVGTRDRRYVSVPRNGCCYLLFMKIYPVVHAKVSSWLSHPRVRARTTSQEDNPRVRFECLPFSLWPCY